MAEAGGNKAVNLGGEHLVLLTARIPDMSEYAAQRSRITTLLETVYSLDQAGLVRVMDELGAMSSLRDTFGSESMPGAVRAAVRSPADLAYLMRAVLAHWERGNSQDSERPTQATQTEGIANAQQRALNGGATRVIRSSSPDEEYARSLMNDDGGQRYFPPRRQSS